MSVVIAYIDKNNECFMKGDSQCTNGSMSTIRLNNKVTKHEKDGLQVFFGATGSYRFINLIEFMPSRLHSFASVYKDDISLKFLVVEFIPLLTHYLKTSNYEIRDGDQLMICHQGGIYVIDHSYQVGQPKGNFFAIGTGAKYALGALEILNDASMNNEQLVNRALEISSKYDIYTTY